MKHPSLGVASSTRAKSASRYGAHRGQLVQCLVQRDLLHSVQELRRAFDRSESPADLADITGSEQALAFPRAERRAPPFVRRPLVVALGLQVVGVFEAHRVLLEKEFDRLLQRAHILPRPRFRAPPLARDRSELRQVHEIEHGVALDRHQGEKREPELAPVVA